MNSLPIVALCVLALFQNTVADPRPEFALAVSVTGTSRVTGAANAVSNVVTAITSPLQSFSLQSQLTLLSDVETVVAKIANQFEPLAANVVSTISSLASDGTGDITNAYSAALGAVNAAIGFAGNKLPGLKTSLATLVGTDLPDKFQDSFEFIGKGLQALLVSLNALQSGAASAVAEAGSANVPSKIVHKYLPPATVSELVYALHLLKAHVPLLEYVISSTIEDIELADQFIIVLDHKVDSTIGASSALMQQVSDIIDPIENFIIDTLSTIGGDIVSLESEFSGLSNLATASSAGALGDVLSAFKGTLDALSTADPTISAVLGGLSTAFTDSYDIINPLYYIYDSALVDALITTLISNGKYSQYCFYKYKDLLCALLDLIAFEASECIAQEAERLQYYQETIGLMLDILFYDFADVSEDLTICDRITDADNLQACTAKFVSIYTDLEGSFGDKLLFVYLSLQHEMAASGNRLQICIRMSQSELNDTEVPVLLQDIHYCATEGPNGQNE